MVVKKLLRNGTRLEKNAYCRLAYKTFLVLFQGKMAALKSAPPCLSN